MKPILLLGTLLVAASAHADFLGLTLEGGKFSPDATLELEDTGIDGVNSTSTMDSDGGTYWSVALEHPIPVIPNLRVEGTELESTGTISTTYEGNSVTDADIDLDLSHTDYTLYYELLDGLFWLNFDFGLTLRKYDGSVDINDDVTSLSATVPMLYVAPAINIPGTGLSLVAEVKTLSFGDNEITDSTFKVMWDIAPVLGVEAGIRSHEVTLKDVSDLDLYSNNEGAFFAVYLDF